MNTLSRGSGAEVIALTPTFKWIFVSVLGLTVLSLVLSIVLALVGAETEARKTLLSTLADVYKMGFTAILGLLGGKAL